MRELCADFAEVPSLEDIPDYNKHVRKVLSLEVLRSNLTAHEYRSMAAFSKDFYSLLNNARSVTLPSSDIWRDSELLAEVFEASKARSLIGPFVSKNATEDRQVLAVTVQGNEDTAIGGHRIEMCMNCKQKVCFLVSLLLPIDR